MNGDECRRRQGREDASTTTNHVIHHQELNEGGRERTGPFCACSLTIHHGLDSFELMAICGNDNAGGKSVTLLQRNDHSQMLRVRVRFLTLSQLLKPGRISLSVYVGSKSSKWA